MSTTARRKWLPRSPSVPCRTRSSRTLFKSLFLFLGGEGVSNKGALVSLGPRGIIHRVTFAHPRWLRQGTAANPPGGEDRSVGEVPWEQAFLSVSLFKNKEINVFRIRNPLAPCRRL